MDSHNVRRILGLLEGSPQDKQQLLRQAMESLQLGHAGVLTPSLLVKEDFLRNSRHLLRPALFPHCGSPIPPWNNGISSLALAWNWVFEQITGPLRMESRIHRSAIPQIQSTLRDALSEWAWRHNPFFSPPRIISQFASEYTNISEICMTLNDWCVSPPLHAAEMCSSM